MMIKIVYLCKQNLTFFMTALLCLIPKLKNCSKSLKIFKMNTNCKENVHEVCAYAFKFLDIFLNKK